jgi:hypothetical protein
MVYDPHDGKSHGHHVLALSEWYPLDLLSEGRMSGYLSFTLVLAAVDWPPLPVLSPTSESCSASEQPGFHPMARSAL